MSRVEAAREAECPHGRKRSVHNARAQQDHRQTTCRELRTHMLSGDLRFGVRVAVASQFMPLVDPPSGRTIDGHGTQVNNAAHTQIAGSLQHVSRAFNGHRRVTHGTMNDAVASLHGLPNLLLGQHVAGHHLHLAASNPCGAVPPAHARAQRNPSKCERFCHPAADESRRTRNQHAVHVYDYSPPRGYSPSARLASEPPSRKQGSSLLPSRARRRKFGSWSYHGSEKGSAT